mgnify:CR=1 FL=1
MLKPLHEAEVKSLIQDLRDRREALVESVFERTRRRKTKKLREAIALYAEKREIAGNPTTEIGLLRVANRGETAVRKATLKSVGFNDNLPIIETVCLIIVEN